MMTKHALLRHFLYVMRKKAQFTKRIQMLYSSLRIVAIACSLRVRTSSNHLIDNGRVKPAETEVFSNNVINIIIKYCVLFSITETDEEQNTQHEGRYGR